MRTIRIDLTIANILNYDCQDYISFVVDTEIARSRIPEDLAEKIEIDPLGIVSIELPGGTIREYPYGVCLFEYNGEIIAGNVIIGSRESTPLAGSHILENFRIMIDYKNDTISQQPAIKTRSIYIK